MPDNSSEAAILAKVLQAEPQDAPNAQHIKSSTLNLTIINLYKKYAKKYENREADQESQLIANAAVAWTKKKLRWISIQPFVRAEQLNVYATNFKGTDSSYFKKDYPIHYGLSVSMNVFDIYPNRWAYLLRGTVTGMEMSNTAILSGFNYESRTAFFTNSTGVTEITKSGVAYNQSDIKSDFVTQLSLEGYILPLKSFFPGVYASTSFNMSRLYRLPKIESRQNDDLQIPIEGGLVFNVVSKEKDKQKTLLSLLFFGRFEDITDSRRITIETQEPETKDEFINRNVSFGLRVGIPVNLPKRANE